MLSVTIDLIPHGVEDKRRQIGSMIIFNDGTGDAFNGNYKYTINYSSGSIKGKLGDFDRSKDVFHLLRDILNKSIVEG